MRQSRRVSLVLYPERQTSPDLEWDIFTFSPDAIGVGEIKGNASIAPTPMASGLNVPFVAARSISTDF